LVIESLPWRGCRVREEGKGESQPRNKDRSFAKR